ncbi:MAG: hypothetical protein ABI615_01770 [Chthoniobacterales bacterium]
MLNITINLATGQAKPTQTAVIKAGGGLPLTITFSESPGANPVIELAFSPQSSSPSIVAYLDEFDAQNETVYTGVLDANDTRLIGLLTGKDAQTLNCEIVVTTTAGGRIPFPNFPVTAQQPLLTGPASSEGGPVYLTEALGDLRYQTLAGLPARIITVPVPANSTVIPDWSASGGYSATTIYRARDTENTYEYTGTETVAGWMKHAAAATLF